MEFRHLLTPDSRAVFECRLRGLTHAPDAFLTTVAEEQTRGIRFVEKILSESSDDNLIFGAISEGIVYGMIGILKSEKEKLQHKATIYGMYVDVEKRRTGIGGTLLDIAIQHAQEKMDVEIIQLSVVSTNSAARRLYESRGFVLWGTEPMAMSLAGRYFDEDHFSFKL